MTKKQIRQAQAQQRRWMKNLEREYKAMRLRDDGEDGWNGPCGQMPRPGELAMGVYYDPERGRRNPPGRR